MRRGRLPLRAASAQHVRLDQIEQLFFAVARAVDWDALAGSVSAGLRRGGHAGDGWPAIAEVAQLTTWMPASSTAVCGARSRSACCATGAGARAGPGGVSAGAGAAREQRRRRGRARGRAGLVPRREGAGRGPAPAPCHGRIGRHNARPLLLSLARLLLVVRPGGLVLGLDYARLAEARRPPLAERTGLYYSKAAVLDAFEVLRQLIDATDELRGVLVLAVVPPELVTDELAGCRRTPPCSCAWPTRSVTGAAPTRSPRLVRLEVRLEAVPSARGGRPPRAVEALRSGVPSWDAVARSAPASRGLEDRSARSWTGPAGPAGGGLLLGAGFGAGKTHRSRIWRSRARAGFAVSMVVMSRRPRCTTGEGAARRGRDADRPETRVRGGLADAVAALDPDTPRYAELCRWLNSANAAVDGRFAATLHLLPADARR